MTCSSQGSGTQVTASDFSESAVLGRRGQAARSGWRHVLVELTAVGSDAPASARCAATS